MAQCHRFWNHSGFGTTQVCPTVLVPFLHSLASSGGWEYYMSPETPTFVISQACPRGANPAGSSSPSGVALAQDGEANGIGPARVVMIC